MPLNKHIRNLLLPFYRMYYDLKWKQYVKQNSEINLIIGGANIDFPGWFETDILILDVTNEKQFQRFFSRHKINKVMAEHVLEHLTTEQIELMLVHLYKYSASNLNIRIAVPDGFHANPEYIDMVKPGGTGNGADDHKHLFTYKSLSAIFERNKFKAHPLEYWDEQGNFHSHYKNDDKGLIRRSMANDSRNAGGKPVYTSLIIDFTKA
jgi:predicted SAM-dependent methyltransferase